VRPVGVVVLAPGIQRRLQHLQAGEWAVVIEQLELQRLVQPLDLPRGGRRGGPGEPMGDAVLPADPLKQHHRRAGPDEPPGKHRPVEFLSGVKGFGWWS
jgi:hypothetical protein